MKIHLHEENFDGARHAVCRRFPHDPKPGEKYFDMIVAEEVFEQLSPEKRCSYCSSYWFPNGEPEEWYYTRLKAVTGRVNHRVKN